MPERTWRVPARIETARLVLRCYSPSDAETMDAVIPANREHLKTFMPWALDEPIGPAARRELVEKFIVSFEERLDFTMGIFDRATGAYLGGTGLHTRQGPDVLEIGYWLAQDAQGKGLMTEAATALSRVAFTYSGAPRVEIRCETMNQRSRNVPRRLGFALEGVVDDNEVWVLTRESFADSAASAAPLPRIFDATGSELSWPV